eukprot:313746-Amphidinium_carterae.4
MQSTLDLIGWDWDHNERKNQLLESGSESLGVRLSLKMRHGAYAESATNRIECMGWILKCPAYLPQVYVKDQLQLR